MYARDHPRWFPEIARRRACSRGPNQRIRIQQDVRLFRRAMYRVTRPAFRHSLHSLEIVKRPNIAECPALTRNMERVNPRPRQRRKMPFAGQQSADREPCESTFAQSITPHLRTQKPWGTDRPWRSIQARQPSQVVETSTNESADSHGSIPSSCRAKTEDAGRRPADRWERSKIGITLEATPEKKAPADEDKSRGRSGVPKDIERRDRQYQRDEIRQHHYAPFESRHNVHPTVERLQQPGVEWTGKGIDAAWVRRFPSSGHLEVKLTVRTDVVAKKPSLNRTNQYAKDSAKGNGSPIPGARTSIRWLQRHRLRNPGTVPRRPVR